MSARQIGTALWRVTGQRRRGPEPAETWMDDLEAGPEPSLGPPRETSPMPAAVAGDALVFGPSWPCGRNGHVPAADDPRVCHYCGEEVAA